MNKLWILGIVLASLPVTAVTINVVFAIIGGMSDLPTTPITYDATDTAGIQQTQGAFFCQTGVTSTSFCKMFAINDTSDSGITVQLNYTSGRSTNCDTYLYDSALSQLNFFSLQTNAYQLPSGYPSGSEFTVRIVRKTANTESTGCSFNLDVVRT